MTARAVLHVLKAVLGQSLRVTEGVSSHKSSKAVLQVYPVELEPPRGKGHHV